MPSQGNHGWVEIEQPSTQGTPGSAADESGTLILPGWTFPASGKLRLELMGKNPGQHRC